MWEVIAESSAPEAHIKNARQYKTRSCESFIKTLKAQPLKLISTSLFRKKKTFETSLKREKPRCNF